MVATALAVGVTHANAFIDKEKEAQQNKDSGVVRESVNVPTSSDGALVDEVTDIAESNLSSSLDSSSDEDAQEKFSSPSAGSLISKIESIESELNRIEDVELTEVTKDKLAQNSEDIVHLMDDIEEKATVVSLYNDQLNKQMISGADKVSSAGDVTASKKVDLSDKKIDTSDFITIDDLEQIEAKTEQTVTAQEVKSQSKEKAKAQAKAELKAKARAKAEAEAEAKAEAKAKDELKAKLKAKKEAKAKAEREAELQAEAKAELIAKAEAEAELRAKAKAKAELRAKAKAKAELRAKAKAKAELRAKAKAKAELRAKAKAKAALQAKAKAKTKARSRRGRVSSRALRAARIASRRAHSRSKGLCARYVRQALQGAGYKFKPNSSAYMYATKGTLRKAGFTRISNRAPRKVGDIVVVSRSRAHPHGHMSIFDGRNWNSDFRQRKANPYRRHYRYTTWRDMSGSKGRRMHMAKR